MQNCQEVWVLPAESGSDDSVYVNKLPEPVTIHNPGASNRVSYPRVVQLPDGNLLASFAEEPGTGFGHNPIKIYRSTDGGVTWTWISDLTDTHRGQGLEDPQLFVMPVTMGSVLAGTIIAGVRSMYWVSESYIDLYRSDDGGETWSFMSSVASGNGWESNVYEPFFIIDTSGRLLCYYSDERDNTNHSQKLVYQASTDGGYTWGPLVEVVALPTQSARPGMPLIAKMGNNQFIMTYEYVGHAAPYHSAVYYKTSSDGYNWGAVTNPGTQILAADNSGPGGTPTVMWTPAGSTKGTVIVTCVFNNNPSSTRGSDNFVNYNYGVGPWYRVQQPLSYDPGNASAGYSRSVIPSSDGNTVYHINTVDFSSTHTRAMFSATPASFTPGYVYKIVNKSSHLVLGISGGSTNDGAKAAQGTENYAEDQKWAIVDADEGGPNDYVKIINKKSKKVLDILYGSTADGADAIQWPSNTSSSQLWEVIPVGDGFHKLKNVNSGKLLGVTGCSPDPGTVADQWSDNGAACQNWQLQVIGLVVDE